MPTEGLSEDEVILIKLCGQSLKRKPSCPRSARTQSLYASISEQVGCGSCRIRLEGGFVFNN